VDQSTSGYNLSQTTEAHMPALVSDAFNGKPAVSFEKGANSAVSDYLVSSALQLGNPCTLFFVMKPDKLPDGYNQRFAGHYGGGQFRFNSEGKASVANNSTPAPLDSPLMTVGEFDLLIYRINESVDIGINQYQLTRTLDSGMAFSSTDFLLGGIPNGGPSDHVTFDGDFAEVIIYNRPLSATDINRVGYYLAQRYQMTDTSYIPLKKLHSKVYDFSTATGSTSPGTTLNGQDNWVNTGGHTNGATVYNVGSANNTGYAPNCEEAEQLKRVNDSTWSFSIPTNSLEVVFQYYARIGNLTGTGWNRSSEIAILQNGSNSVFNPGFEGRTSNKWSLSAGATSYLSDAAATTSTNEYKYLKCVLDLVDRNGEGTASMYESTDGTTWTPIAGLLCKDVTLATRGVDDTSKWNTLFIDLQNGAQIDNITIQPIVLRTPDEGIVIILQ
jgi:hypothetical protein